MELSFLRGGRWQLSFPVSFPLGKIYSMRAGFSTFLNSVILIFDSCPGRLALFLRVTFCLSSELKELLSVNSSGRARGFWSTPAVSVPAQGCYESQHLQRSPEVAGSFGKEGYQKSKYMVSIYLLHFSLYSLRRKLSKL